MKINFKELLQNLKQQKLIRLKQFRNNEFLLGMSLFFLPISIKANSFCLILFFVNNIYHRIEERSLFGLKYFLIAGIIFFIQVVSFLLSANSNEAYKKLILFLVFPMLAFLFPRKEIEVDKVFRHLLFGVLTVLVYAFIRSAYDIIFLNERFDYGRGPEILLKYTPHHAYLSLFIIISIIVVIYQIGKDKISYANIYISPFLFIILFILPSRTALITAIIMIPLCAIVFLKGKYTFKHISLFVALLLVLTLIGLSIDFTRDKLLYAYYEFFDIPTVETPFYGITTRQKIWESCLGLIDNTPFLGYGIGDIQEMLNSEYIRNGYDNILNLNAHNQYLQNILQYGLFMSSVMFLIFFEVIRRLILKKDWLLVWIWIITILFLATESMLNRQWGVVYFAILLILSCYSLSIERFKYYFGIIKKT